MLNINPLRDLALLNCKYSVTLTDILDLFQNAFTVQDVNEWLCRLGAALAEKCDISIHALLEVLERDNKDAIAVLNNVAAVRARDSGIWDGWEDSTPLCRRVQAHYHIQRADGIVDAGYPHSRSHRVASHNDFDAYAGFLRSAQYVAKRLLPDMIDGSAYVRLGDARRFDGVKTHPLTLR